jgi:hypothetical protein
MANSSLRHVGGDSEKGRPLDSSVEEPVRSLDAPLAADCADPTASTSDAAFRGLRYFTAPWVMPAMNCRESAM